jgi:hypothetical protein
MTVLYNNPMKTPQIMVRSLSGLPVRQNHKTGMFNANDLLSIYNEQNAGKEKRLDHFLNTATTQDYMKVIEEDIAGGQAEAPNELGFDLENSNYRKNSKLIRPETVVKTSRGSVNGGTWMHPYLFIDFAMWLSPEFKLQCMKWLSDKLIKFRDEAGDSFLEVNRAIRMRHGEQRQIVYVDEARMINSLVFEGGQGGQRNQATEAELSLLDRLQKADIKLVEMGLPFESRKKNLKIFKSLC